MELSTIQSKIYEIRGQRVILDRDLAQMYDVSTSNLNKAVKRNIDRFPDDFMFQLNRMEFDEHIRKAVELCKASNFTEEELAIYKRCQNRIILEKALNESLKEGKKQGLEEGEAIGMKKATEAIIRNAHQNGLSIEQIQAITGLSATDIENVISKPN